MSGKACECLKYLLSRCCRRARARGVPPSAAWPDRPVTLIVPYAAGGISRRAGAAHRRAPAAPRSSNPSSCRTKPAPAASSAPPTRRTPSRTATRCSSAPIAMLTLSPLTTKVNYDPDKDFMPVSVVASAPFVITVNQGFPATTLEEFIAEVKKKPGVYTYASAGAGSTTHVSALVVPEERGPRHDPRAVSRRRPGVHRYVRRQCPDDLGDAGRADAVRRHPTR